MKMAGARANHAGWRELIAARLDRPLTRSETRSLAEHLRACSACREADRDYREQRSLLRALPPRTVPRDLWPRTSAALDREVARGSHRLGRASRRVGRTWAPSAALMTSITALGVIAALGVMQIVPSVSVAPPSASGPAVAGPATPFAIARQPLAFVGNDAAQLYVYQTQVGQACPANAPDCAVDGEGVVRTPVNLPASVHARNAALSPSGNALAIVGRSGGREVIAVVLLPEDPAASPTTPSTTADPQPTPTDAPPIVVAILENVESAGAPPAWSPSGDMLAFSAMPADGSHGPDVYLWSPNDVLARPVTSDHGSYFASWSGEDVVISRVAAKGEGDLAPLSTVVLDPTTSEERPVGGPPLWLPAVNREHSHAVAWLGELDLASGLAVPLSGALFVIDWAAIDPFAPANEPNPPPVAQETPGATDAQPTQEPTQAPTDPPTTPSVDNSPTPAPSATPVTPSADPSATPGPQATDDGTAPGATTEPSALPPGWVELDLGRDTSIAPVVDWEARWSLDGQVLGVWLADTLGSTWGRLAVMAVEPVTHAVQTVDPLLPATLARRGFSLGLSRVVWVAPSEDNPDGELRIRTWSDDGVGGVRLQEFMLEKVVPAF